MLQTAPGDRDVIPANEAWTAIFDQQLSGSRQSSSHVSSMHLSRESYDTISKDATFSDGTRSTHFDDEGYSIGYSVYDSDDLSSQVSRELQPQSPPKKAPKKAPEPTVFVLQHHIPSPMKKEDRVEEAREIATREEHETERDEPVEEHIVIATPEKEKKKEPMSFARFRKQFSGKKKKSGKAGTTGREAPPKDDPEPTPSEAKQSQAKPSLRSKGFLLSKRQSSKSLTKDDERTASLTRLRAVSSTESEEDDRDSSTDGGSLNTYDSEMINRDDVSVDDVSPVEESRGKSQRRGSGRGASTVAATAVSRSQDDLSVGRTVDDDKSVRSSKSNLSTKSGRSIKSNRSSKSGRSIKSNRSSMSIRSLKGILKRKSKDGKNDDNSLEDTESGAKKVRNKRSWMPMRRRRSSKKNEPSKPMKKPVSL